MALWFRMCQYYHFLDEQEKFVSIRGGEKFPSASGNAQTNGFCHLAHLYRVVGILDPKSCAFFQTAVAFASSETYHQAHLDDSQLPSSASERNIATRNQSARRQSTCPFGTNLSRGHKAKVIPAGQNLMTRMVATFVQALGGVVLQSLFRFDVTCRPSRDSFQLQNKS